MICVPTPLSEDGGPDLSRGHGRRRGDRPAPAARHAGRAGVDDLPGHDRGVSCGRSSRPVGPAARASTSTSRSRPERIDPGNPTFGIAQHPEGRRRRSRRPARTGRVAFYGGSSTTVVPRQGHPRGRDGQAAGEHLPARQHRAGQRDGAVLPRARHRPVGRHPAAPAPSRSGSRRSTPARASAGTASRSTRTTCRHRVAQQLGYPFRFVELAQEINATMPAYVARRAQNLLNDDGAGRQRGRACCCSGVTYKAEHRRPARVAGDPAGPAAAPARGARSSTTTRTSPPGACPGPGRPPT